MGYHAPNCVIDKSNAATHLKPRKIHLTKKLTNQRFPPSESPRRKIGIEKQVLGPSQAEPFPCPAVQRGVLSAENRAFFCLALLLRERPRLVPVLRNQKGV